MGSPEAALAAFVPRLVRAAVAGGNAGPLVMRGPMVVAFVDISGFSGVATACETLGPVGPELLGEITNAVLDPVVEATEAAGGDIVIFPGDAAVAVFPAVTAGSLDLAAAHAGACAMALASQTVSARGLREDPIHLKVGLAAGDVALELLSDSSVHGNSVAVPLVSGLPVVHAARLAGDVAPGEVGVAPSAAEALQRAGARLGVNGSRLLDAAPAATVPRRLEVPPLPPRALERLVVSRVRETATTATMDWLGEFRELSVLFLNVSSAREQTLGAAGRQQLAADVFREVRAVDGDIVQVACDDKGLTFVVAWGLPGHTHEDDARRAVEAALAIRRASAVELGAGITHGRAFVGIRGGQGRRELALQGVRVVRAARLASVDDVLVDDGVRHAIGRWFACEPVDGLRLKGLAPDTPVHRPRRRDDTVEQMTHRSVREHELRIATMRLEGLRSAGEGGVLVIRGDAGFGKSVLLERLVHHIADLQLELLRGRGDALEVLTPWHAARGLMRWVLSGDPTAPRLQELVATLQLRTEVKERLPLLTPLLQDTIPDSPLTEPLVGSGRTEAACSLLTELVGAQLAGRNAVLLLEDAHWTDSSTWQLLLTLRQALPQLLIVLAMRPVNDLPRAGRQLMDDASLVRMELRPLTVEQMTTLACETLSVEAIPPQAATLMAERCAGHPYLVDQFAQMLVELGWVRVFGNECRLDAWPSSFDELPTDGGATSIVGSRLDRLPEARQRLLKVASVLGERVEASLLAGLAQPHEDLAGDLTALSTQGLLLRDEDSLRFDHAITRRVIYERMAFKQRRDLHRRAAALVLSVAGESARDVQALAAHHHRLAGEHDAASGHAAAAASRALDGGADLEAAALFADALADVEHLAPARRPTTWMISAWRAGRGIALYRLGELAKAREELEAALELVGMAAPRPGMAGTIVLAQQAWGQWRLRSRVSGASAMAPEHADRLEVIALGAERLSELWMWERESLPMLASTLISVNLAERAGRLRHAARGYAMLAFTLGVSRLTRLADSYFARARNTADQTSDLAGATFASYSHGVYRAGRCEWEAGREGGRRGLRLAEQLNDPQEREVALATLGNVDYFTGQLRSSHALYEEIASSAKRRANIQHEVWGLYGMARCELRWADLSPTEDHCLASLDLLRQVPEATSLIITHGLLAEVARYRDDLDGALAHAEAAASRIRAAPPSVLTLVDGYVPVVATHLARWARSGDARARRDARRAAHRAIRDLWLFAAFFPVGGAFYDLMKGCAAWLDRRPRAAGRHWRAATLAAGARGLPWEQRLAAAHLERLLDEAPPAPLLDGDGSQELAPLFVPEAGGRRGP